MRIKIKFIKVPNKYKNNHKGQMNEQGIDEMCAGVSD